MSTRGCEFNVLLKDGGIRGIGHRTSDIQYPHGKPASPVLKSTRVRVLMVGKDCGRNCYLRFPFLDCTIDSLDEHRYLFALEFSKLVWVGLSRSDGVNHRRLFQLTKFPFGQPGLQPLSELIQRRAAVIKIRAGK